MNLAKNLRIESVSRLHPAPPHYLAPSQTVAEAVTLMRREEVGCLLICDNAELVGVFTERDLIRRILARDKPLTLALSECMTPEPAVVEMNDSIASVIEKMQAGGYRNVPVVNESGKPVGILSVKQIVHYIVEHFPDTIYNLPPDPNMQQREREGA